METRPSEVLAERMQKHIFRCEHMVTHKCKYSKYIFISAITYRYVCLDVPVFLICKRFYINEFTERVGCKRFHC